MPPWRSRNRTDPFSGAGALRAGCLQAGVSGTPTVQLFFEKEMKQQWRGVKQRREFRAAIEALIPNN